MKKPKTSKIKIESIRFPTYTVKCPHCCATIVGGFDEYVIILKCLHCKNPIKLIWI